MRGLLLTLSCCCSFAATSLHAQSGESHQPIPRTLDRKTAVELLGGALTRAGADREQLHGDLDALGQLLQAIIKNPERFGLTEDKLKDMARSNPKDLGVDPNDPNVQALARKLANQIKADPDQAALLKRLVGDLKPAQPLDPPKIQPPDLAVSPIGPRPVDPVKPGDPPRDGSRPLAIESRPRSATPTTLARRSSKSWLSKQLAELRPGSTGLSEGLTKRLFNIFGRDTRVTGRGRELGRDPSRITPRFDAPLIRNLPDRIAPSVPRVNLPSAPSMSAPSGEGLNAGALAILLLVVAFVVLLLWPRPRGWITGRGDPWRLGPWPIAPSAVRTRQDLIKAFEHLALLLLGRKAEATNHLDIAKQLGRQPEATSQHRAAADELADLYEQSRYAPPQGELTADEVATARRDLCFLAGVARA